jgi:hypothetical protein
MRNTTWKAAVLAGAALALGACPSNSTPPTAATNHLVTISWAPNHESGVNKAGGGYRVFIVGKPPVDVPWVSGATAPTSTDVTLLTGSYSVTVAAYAALDAQGGSSGSQSAPSQVLTVNVP